jgi:diguanylate cyclase (GGDEF)-like protein
MVGGGVVALGTAGWAIGRKDDQLLQRNRDLQELSRRLQTLSTTDGLTGIPNRRALDDRLEIEVARTNRYGIPIALVMLDLDHFKPLNDRYGHQVGDLVLRKVGGLLDSEKRIGDFVARYGGEEFVAVLPHADAAAAVAWAERVRTRLDAMVFEVGAEGITVTASFGVAVARPGHESREALLEAADHALYEAKSAGRDRVMEAQRTPEPVRRGNLG